MHAIMTKPIFILRMDIRKDRFHSILFISIITVCIYFCISFRDSYSIFISAASTCTLIPMIELYAHVD
jgi:hypothetical protein